MNSPHSFNMQIMSISWPQDFLGSRFLITFSMSFISKDMADKDPFDFCGHSDGL